MCFRTMALFSVDEEISYLQNMRKHFETHFRVENCLGHSSKVHSVDWSCDGRKLASGNWWILISQQRLEPIKVIEVWLIFSCPGSFDKTVTIFSLAPDSLVREHTLRGHQNSVDQLCWHPSNPNHLCTASLDRSVRLWDSRSSKSTATINTKGILA